jgi:2-iminoacetate synthase
MLTFKEYLEDYATPETRRTGLTLIEKSLKGIPSVSRRDETRNRLAQIEQGERDLCF